MVATETFQTWGARSMCILTILCACFGLSSLADLNHSTIGYYYIMMLFVAGIILSIMMVLGAGAYDPLSSTPGTVSFEMLKYSTVLSHTFTWIFIPVSATIAVFYMKKEDFYSIRRFITNEKDLAFFSILMGVSVIGMDHIDRVCSMSFFPLLMMIACTFVQNGFGIAAGILCIVNNIFNYPIRRILFSAAEQQVRTSSLFQINYRAMALVLLVAGSVIIMTELKTISPTNAMTPFWKAMDRFGITTI